LLGSSDKKSGNRHDVQINAAKEDTDNIKALAAAETTLAQAGDEAAQLACFIAYSEGLLKIDECSRICRSATAAWARRSYQTARPPSG
jgi:hypothetical protein